MQDVFEINAVRHGGFRGIWKAPAVGPIHAYSSVSCLTGAWIMKFNPYPVLLTTGALMLATVVFAQTGTGVALLKAGASSVNGDVSTSKASTSDKPVSDTKLVVASADSGDYRVSQE
jgi:hypothetical protein